MALPDRTGQCALTCPQLKGRARKRESYVYPEPRIRTRLMAREADAKLFFRQSADAREACARLAEAHARSLALGVARRRVASDDAAARRAARARRIRCQLLPRGPTRHRRRRLRSRPPPPRRGGLRASPDRSRCGDGAAAAARGGRGRVPLRLREPLPLHGLRAQQRRHSRRRRAECERR